MKWHRVPLFPPPPTSRWGPVTRWQLARGSVCDVCPRAACRRGACMWPHGHTAAGRQGPSPSWTARHVLPAVKSCCFCQNTMFNYGKIWLTWLMPEFLPEVPGGRFPRSCHALGHCLPLSAGENATLSRETRRLDSARCMWAGVGTALQQLLPSPAVAVTHAASLRRCVCVLLAFPQFGWVLYATYCIWVSVAHLIVWFFIKYSE